jgi:hypothetical protein
VNLADNESLAPMHSAAYYAAENGYTEIAGQLIAAGVEN